MTQPTTTQLLVYCVIAILFAVPSLFIAGDVGIAFELLLAVFVYQLILKKSDLKYSQKLLRYSAILLVGLVLQWIGIIGMAYMVQNSSMGR